MNESYCGIKCQECPVYNLKFTQKPKHFGLVAGAWSRLMELRINKKELYCEGCRSQSRFVHCRNCEIENCCKEKGVNSCNVCSLKNACERYNSFMEWFTVNKTLLMWDKIRKPS